MKYLYLLLPLSVCVSAFSQSPAEPQELVQLTEQWQRARTQATAPIDKKYVEALTIMKTALTKKGDLQGALAVDARLNSLRTSSESSANSSKSEEGLPKTKASLERFLVGTVWTVTTTQDGFVSEMEFTGRGTAMFGREYKWEAIDRRSIKIEFTTLNFNEDMTGFACIWGTTGQRTGVFNLRKPTK